MTTDPERGLTQSESQESNISVGGGMVVPTQPKEIAYPLLRESFDTLIEGEITNKDEKWRNISISIFSTSFLSLLTLLVTVDWTSLNVTNNPVGLLLVILITAITLATFVLMIIFFVRARKLISSSYSRTKAKITDWFNQPRQ